MTDDALRRMVDGVRLPETDVYFERSSADLQALLAGGGLFDLSHNGVL